MQENIRGCVAIVVLVVHNIQCHVQLIIVNILYDFMIRFTTIYGIAIINININIVVIIFVNIYMASLSSILILILLLLYSSILITTLFVIIIIDHTTEIVL